MLMATYHLVEKAKASGYDDLVAKWLDEDKFIDTIHTRADYERTGFFILKLRCILKSQVAF